MTSRLRKKRPTTRLAFHRRGRIGAEPHRPLAVLVLLAVLPLSLPGTCWSAGTQGVRLRKSWPTPAARRATEPAAQASRDSIAQPAVSRSARSSRGTETERAATGTAPAGNLRWRSQPTEVRHWRPVSAPAVVRASRGASSRRVLDPFQQTPLAAAGGGSRAVVVAAAEAMPGALRPPGEAAEGAAATGPADADAAPGGPNLSSEELPAPSGPAPTDSNPPPPPGISPIGEPATGPSQFSPPSATQEMPSREQLETEDMARGRVRALQQEECNTAVARLRAHRLDKIALDVQLTGEAGSDYPIECALGNEPAPSRAWPETIYTWKASGVGHKPLYFDEFALERHGHSKGPFVQPLYSAGHFYVNLAVLPYKMGLRPPTECVYALGHYRPGSCAPYLVPTPPLSWRAGLAEAGAAVGVAAILP